MNALVFTEDNNLHITKPNGLRYQFENVDKPNLGFDFDVIVYDNEEFKIEKYDDEMPFDEQERKPLTETERNAIETYIENSEPPPNTSLNNQHIDELARTVYEYLEQQAQQYQFREFFECAGCCSAEGSVRHRTDWKGIQKRDHAWEFYLSD